MAATNSSFTSLRYDLMGFGASPKESPLSSPSSRTPVDALRPLMSPAPMALASREAYAVVKAAGATAVDEGVEALATAVVEEGVAAGPVITAVRRVTWLGTATREAVEEGMAAAAAAGGMVEAAVAAAAATIVESLGISPEIVQRVHVRVYC
ncbi:hypothetical protein E2542_SST10578 [Spatholobus suberectus]|nr:hypothetical protein E2542_SST10578 [Spatholobus suberectus]